MGQNPGHANDLRYNDIPGLTMGLSLTERWEGGGERSLKGGGHAGRARVLGIWPGGARSLEIWPRGSRSWGGEILGAPVITIKSISQTT